MDGKVIGRINCTLANWTGLAFKVPITHLYKCKENGEIVDDSLTKNRIFNSTSYAASFILGMYTNVRTGCNNLNDVTLKDIE